MVTIKNYILKRIKARKSEAKYYNNHKEEILERKRKKREKNYEHYKKLWTKYNFKTKEKRLQYSKDNRERLNELEKIRIKNRRAIDNNFAIKCRLRSLLRCALKRYSDGKEFSSTKYGINWTDIINHLKPFPDEIKEYHIDHIRPLSTFNLAIPGEVKKAFAPSNHQWLTIKENLLKSNKCKEVEI